MLLTRRRFFRGLAASLGPPFLMSRAEAQPLPLEPGRITGGQPAGLFYRLQVVGSPRMETRTWLFLPGQRASRVYPYGGVFDPARCNIDTCGSYQIGGSQLVVRWDGGSVQRWAFAATADGITLDGTLHRPARAMTGPALVGTWAEGGGANTYVFDGNGRFSFGASGGGLTGTYQLQAFALTLAFADGDPRRRTLFVAGPSEPVGLISVDMEVYARK